jgi:molecular chaperone HscB
MAENYFAFYGLPVSFNPDLVELKRLFYENSRKYHPDFFVQAGEERQAEVLELATINNLAYRTLSDEDKRIQYILRLYDMMEEEGKAKLPQEFLMDMMDINEILMELEFEPDAEKLQQVKAAVEKIESQLYESVLPVMRVFDKSPEKSLLTAVKDYFLKKRYLLRIKENITKFAPA